MKPLPIQEKEYRLSLYRLERRAIIPLKWAIFFSTLILWVWLLRIGDAAKTKGRCHHDPQ